MERVQYTTQLDFTDNGTFETGWRIKQGDFGNCELVIRLVNNGVNAYDASIIPQIVFRRADGQSVISVMIPNDGTYKYIFVGNELEVPGFELVDVKYQDSEGRISTASCRFTVVEDTIGNDPTGAHTYDNPVSELVEQATAAAETAIDSSFKAEGFAVGEQGGEPVGPDSPYYHNNAKYYGEMPAQSINYYEQNGFLSRNVFDNEISNIVEGATVAQVNGNTIINNATNAYGAVRYQFLIKAGTYTISIGTITSNSTVQLAIYSSGTYTEKARLGSSGAKITFTLDADSTMRLSIYSTVANNPVTVTNVQIEKGSTASSYTPYAPSNNELTKISAIGTDESGRTTASRSYAQGEHFYKDGKFGKTKTAVAQGATWTLNTNYEESTIADAFKSYLPKTVTSVEITANSSQTINLAGRSFYMMYSYQPYTGGKGMYGISTWGSNVTNVQTISADSALTITTGDGKITVASTTTRFITLVMIAANL